MRKILFISIITAIGMSRLAAQEILPFRPFESFNNDTLAYLEYNFEERAAYYKGKTFAEVMKDLPFAPIGFGGHIKRSEGMVQTHIYIYNVKPNVQHELKDYYICVVWKTPIESLKGMGYKPDAGWLPQYYEFLKDMEVKSVGINPYLLEDRKSGRWRPGGNY